MAADCVCAVVSTAARARNESFLRWHLDGAKFDRVFLYFDHPGDEVDGHSKITLLGGSQTV